MTLACSEIISPCLLSLSLHNSLPFSLSRLQHELDELKEKCSRLEAQMLLKASEVDHLKRAHVQSQEEVAHLKKVCTQSLLLLLRSLSTASCSLPFAPIISPFLSFPPVVQPVPSPFSLLPFPLSLLPPVVPPIPSPPPPSLFFSHTIMVSRLAQISPSLHLAV